MATAYRNLGPGSTKQLVSFINQRLNELRDFLGNAENESNMWQKLDERLQVPYDARGHLRKRCRDLNAAIDEAHREQTTLAGLLDALYVCPACKGHGETNYQNVYDVVLSEPCQKCGGTGELK